MYGVSDLFQMSDKKTGSAEEQKNSSAEAPVRVARTDVVYKLRDLNSNMVESWKEVFENKDYHGGKIQVCTYRVCCSVGEY